MSLNLINSFKCKLFFLGGRINFRLMLVADEKLFRKPKYKIGFELCGRNYPKQDIMTD